MDHWIKLSGEVPCLSLIPLGSFHNNKYCMDPECLNNLKEINAKLSCEEPNTRPLRRAIGFFNVLNKDLIPILLSSKDQPTIFRTTIKLLAELTTPTECLICIDASSSRSSTSQRIVIHELSQLLYSIKEAFLEPSAFEVVIDHLHELLEKKTTLSREDCECVQHSLLLVRNILHVPQRPRNTVVDVESATSSAARQPSNAQTPHQVPAQSNGSNCITADCSQENQRLLWNLFAQRLDRLLINLLASPQKGDWIVTITQLVALFYKDRHFEDMKKLMETHPPTFESSDEHSDAINNTPPIYSPSKNFQFLSLTSNSTPSGEQYGPITNYGSQVGTTTAMTTATIVSPGVTTPVTGKSGSNKRRMVSPETTRSFSSASSQCSHHSDTSRHCSRYSTSSGFHSNESGIQYDKHRLKDSESRKKKSLKRRCHGNSHKSWEKTNADVPSLLTIDTMSMKEIPERFPRKKLRLINRTADNKVNDNNYTPTEEDISHLLKDFILDFLLDGYNTLVGQLHQKLLQDNHPRLDKSHFLWLICYFLPFIPQLKLEVEHYPDVFSIDLLCYLTWEAVCQTEELEIYSFQPSVDVKPCVRRLHLVVKAIGEYLQALSKYSEADSSQIKGLSLKGHEEKRINQLCHFLPAIRDLRQVFLLQLRHFNPMIQSRRYLHDVITTNHILLLTLEKAAKQSGAVGFEINQHLNQFCSRAILDRYGNALEDFKTNGAFVNDCILTILHHVGGDLGRTELLFEPDILRPFTKICDEDFTMCDDWTDLISYVIQKYLRQVHVSSRFKTDWSQKSSNGPHDQEDLICVKSENLMQTEERFNRVLDKPTICENGDPVIRETRTEIESLISQLLNSGFRKQLVWIQSSLLTSCSARLGTYFGQEYRHPITCLSLKMNCPCPIVPWTEEEASALRSEFFLCLLDRLSLLPSTPLALYPRIPREWSASTIYSIALLFGPIDQQKIDFDTTRLGKIESPISNLHQVNIPVDIQLCTATNEFPICKNSNSFESP
ncbi:protein timeless-like [Daphnia pulex]|uniref:protein timeless-like n=1 Tax=Daphnia pulex TaxID=6669 RepID=UPI001EDF0758|nr:protein timeless-like [Daphnia pulex]